MLGCVCWRRKQNLFRANPVVSINKRKCLYNRCHSARQQQQWHHKSFARTVYLQIKWGDAARAYWFGCLDGVSFVILVTQRRAAGCPRQCLLNGELFRNQDKNGWSLWQYDCSALLAVVEEMLVAHVQEEERYVSLKKFNQMSNGLFFSIPSGLSLRGQ